MIVLALDTSSRYCSCAVLENKAILSESALLSGLVHSESLMPMVDDCLTRANLTVKDVDLFACVAGPGSFTGVRIGVCAVKGLAQAVNKPCVGLNTLEVLKENLPGEAIVCPIMDARRGQVYGAVYENGRETLPCDARPIEDVIAFLEKKTAVFLGDGVDAFRETLAAAMGDRARFAPAHLTFTRAAAAAVLAKRAAEENKTVTAAALDAIYLRKPQAEREYASKHPTL